jgi:cell filamentation protein
VNRSSADPYCYPGTEILLNLKGIHDAEELVAFETASVAIRLARLAEQPITGPFDLKRLKTTHRRIFDGVYPWAGELRQNTGMMKKQRTPDRAVVYADSTFIQPALERIFQSLHCEDFLSGLSPQQFAQRAAWFYGELDAIHPFREGNSRTLRQFFSDLAHAAGYTLDWTALALTETGRDELYVARDLAVSRGDFSQLARIFSDSLKSNK